MLKVIVLIVVSSLLFITHTSFVDADVQSCTASVSPTSVNISSNATLTFSVTNTDESQDAIWVRFTRPSTNFTVTGGDATDWSSSFTDSYAYFESNSLNASTSQSFTVNITTSSTAASGASWVVEIADDPQGYGAVTCGGSTSVAINQSINISNIVLSDLTSSSVKVTWNTDVASNSVVEYGTTSSYGSTKTDSSLVTSHSVTLESLSANTTYHYRIKSTDGNGNTQQTSDNTFVAAKASSTATTTVTVNITSTPTPTPIPDTTVPTLSLTTDTIKPFEKAPKLEGKASDNKEIHTVEYSTDKGKTWQKVDELARVDFPTTTFSFTPDFFGDGNYAILLRATDLSNNIGKSKTYSIVIDRLAPQVGGSVLSVGPQILLPINGVYVTLVGLSQNIIVSSVGGPTTINLEFNSTISSMSSNMKNGLWYGALSANKSGVYDINTYAVDGANKRSTRKLHSMAVLENGKVLDSKTNKGILDAQVSLYYKNPRSYKWSLWDGKEFDLKNPQKTTSEGSYTLFIPPGTYYINVKASGYQEVVSSIFSTSTSIPFNYTFYLDPLSNAGLLAQLFPGLFPKQVNVELGKLPSVNFKEKLLGKEAPAFKLPTTEGDVFSSFELRGKPSILTFLSSWSPLASDQMLILDNMPQEVQDVNTVVVLLQETVSQSVLFKSRGAYKTSIVIDADGKLIKSYDIHTLPTHYIVDRFGMVKSVFYGLKNSQELITEVNRVNGR